MRFDSAPSSISALLLALALFAALDATLGEEEPPPPRIFLDKSPRIVAYQLRRLTNRQLLAVERRSDDPKYRPVFEAIIAREGLEAERREEAIDALAELNGTGRIAEVVAAVVRLDRGNDPSGAALHDLYHILAHCGRDALRGQRSALEDLARNGRADLPRQIAYAVLVRAESAPGPVWELAQAAGSPGDLIRAVPMLHDGALGEAFYPLLAPILADGGDAELREAAISVLGSIPGREEDAFRALLPFAREGEHRVAAIRSLRRIPREHWPAEEVGPLARSVVEFVRSVPPGGRTESGVLEAVEFGRELASRLPRPEAEAVRNELDALGVRVVLLRTVPHQMRYDRAYFVVEAGKPAEVVLENVDIMPHNLVITAPGALVEVGTAAETIDASSRPAGREYVPDSENVLHATRLLQSGERERLSFIAPADPGEYPYVCTFPGHWRRMYGVMLVVADLEAWLESPVEPADPLGITRKLVREWTLEDFASELAQPGGHRSFEAGKKLFEEAGCVPCHKVRGAGGSVGPELTEVFVKWKGSREDVLRQLLEPAKVVEEKYRVQLVVTAGGKTLTGLVTAEEEDSITIVTNPQNPVPEEIRRDRILQRVETEGSMMPVGLLNTFQKEEILEILAYLEAGGDPEHAVYGAHH